MISTSKGKTLFFVEKIIKSGTVQIVGFLIFDLFNNKFSNFPKPKLMRNLAFVFILLVSLIYATVLPAQDAVFSQFFNMRSFLNPAFVGIEKGSVTNIGYRKQWPSISGHFTTYALSGDFQVPCIGGGLGFNVLHDDEGEAALQTNAFSLTYAYALRFPGNRGGSKSLFERTNIHFGIRAGYTSKSIDWDRLVFSDQLDPIYGIVRSTGAAIGLQSFGYPDVDAGFLWRQEWKHFRFKHTPFRSALGGSFFHLLRPIQSFNGVQNTVPLRFSFHAAFEIPFVGYKPNPDSRRSFNKRFFLLPYVKYEYQGEWVKDQGVTRLYDWGLYLQTPSALYFGGFLQHQETPNLSKNINALILNAGFVFKQGNETLGDLGLSYDFNIGGISSQTGGVFELTYRLRFPDASLFCNPRTRRGIPKGTSPWMDCNNFF